MVLLVLTILQTIFVINLVRFLTLSKRIYHPYPSCKILTVVLLCGLILRLSQKPWKNWGPISKMTANSPQIIFFWQHLCLMSFYRNFFTVIIRHGYMPKLLRNCTLIPVPKPGKDPSQSDNYRPIALAPNLSKVLDWSILLWYGSFLSTSDLQFGFKPGVSTDSCTGL